MGSKERDNTNANSPQESRAETGNSAQDAAKATKDSPNLRRRLLIAGLASTPVLLSLTNRSALGQNVDCSLLQSVLLGGSVENLPPGFEHKNDGFIQNYYETHCVEGGEQGTGNATGNSGQTGVATGNPNRP
jgi:hypothetical protein